MDFQLTHFFRQVCEDALLIFDVIRINPLFKPPKESWIECFTEGASLSQRCFPLMVIEHVSSAPIREGYCSVCICYVRVILVRSGLWSR